MASRLLRTRRRDTAQTDKPYWQQRGWRLSAGFLALTVVIGALALSVRGVGGTTLASGDLGEAKPVLRSAVTGAAAGDGGGRRDGCRTDDRDVRPPSAAPSDINWQRIAGMKVPASPSAGPLLVSGPVWWCFARTPLGAVMAAHVVQAAIAGPGWRSVADHQLVDNSGRAFLAAQMSRMSGREVSESPLEFAGFKVLAFASSRASVDLLLRGTSQRQLINVTVDLEWSDGDWKVVPRNNGSVSTQGSVISDARGFVMWKV
ncbi:hypothetical protein ACH4C6_33750 [Streptomyces sp. NPDC017943]|uniref:hypothetical protein n=1 Tax=Streptomyces sp. NPDC017943 TaxID=3365019 RepID=UPI0037AEA721